MLQEVALLDVRKEVSFCVKAGCKILGVVENMAGFCCPHCHHVTEIFPPSEEDASGASLRGGEAMAKAVGVPFLGRIPLDPLLSRACEAGVTVSCRMPRLCARTCRDLVCTHACMHVCSNTRMCEAGAMAMSYWFCASVCMPRVVMFIHVDINVTRICG
jgi:hypothetical protein